MMNANMVAGIVQGVAGGAQTAYGLWLTQKAKKGLAKLQKEQMPGYEVSPELQAAYDAQGKIAQDGFSPEEEAAYRGQINRLNTARYNQSLMGGAGTMAGAIGAGIQYGSIGAEQQLFERESSLKRDALARQGTIAGQLQAIQTAQDQLDIQRRLDLEKAYGAAIAQGRATQMQGFNTQVNSLNTFTGTNPSATQNPMIDSSSQAQQSSYQGSFGTENTNAMPNQGFGSGQSMGGWGQSGSAGIGM